MWKANKFQTTRIVWKYRVDWLLQFQYCCCIAPIVSRQFEDRLASPAPFCRRQRCIHRPWLPGEHKSSITIILKLFVVDNKAACVVSTQQNKWLGFSVWCLAFIILIIYCSLIVTLMKLIIIRQRLSGVIATPSRNGLINLVYFNNYVSTIEKVLGFNLRNVFQTLCFVMFCFGVSSLFNFSFSYSDSGLFVSETKFYDKNLNHNMYILK